MFFIFGEMSAPLFPCLIHKLEIPLQNLVEHFIGIQVVGVVESHFVLQSVGILVTDDMGNTSLMEEHFQRCNKDDQHKY